MMRKIAVLVTGSALALSFPVAGAIADQGGVPHDGSQGKGKPDDPGSQGKGKQEKQRTNKGKHKGQQKQNGPNGPNGGPSCPDPFPGQGNGKSTSSLPQQAQNSPGLKCGFTGTDGNDLD